MLQYNGTFLEMLGLARFPGQSTLRRFLKRLPPKTIRQVARLHDSRCAHVFALPTQRATLAFDLDSVVLVIYGSPEDARVGYNPKKPGRRSYHPLLCFEAHFQKFWHGSLRPGDAASSTGVIPFLNVCLAKVPATIARSRIRFRMDSGFFGKRPVEFLDRAGCDYIIVAKEYATIKARARAVWFTPLRNGWAAGEFAYQPHRWQQPHRFVVVRRPIPADPANAEQLTLFQDATYVYHVFVTNDPKGDERRGDDARRPEPFAKNNGPDQRREQHAGLAQRGDRAHGTERQGPDEDAVGADRDKAADQAGEPGQPHGRP